METDEVPEGQVRLDAVAPDESAGAEQPATLAEALGDDGPGIAEEISAELSAEQPTRRSDDDETPSGADPGAEEVAIHQFEKIEGGERRGAMADLAVLSELEVTVSARLGSTQVLLRDLLSASIGSIIQLDRRVGEPVELTANGAVIAHGEIVTVDSSFGLRITSLVAEDRR